MTKSRSAISGRYVTKAYANKHTSTTVNERDKPKPSGGGNKGKKK